jgi:hypothetical protein
MNGSSSRALRRTSCAAVEALPARTLDLRLSLLALLLVVGILLAVL